MRTFPAFFPPFAAAAAMGQLILDQTHSAWGLLAEAGADQLQDSRDRLKQWTDKGPNDFQAILRDGAEDVMRCGERARRLGQAFWKQQLETAEALGTTFQAPAKEAPAAA